MATVTLNIPLVRKFMAQREWSERDMAGHMHIAYSYLNRILSGKRQIGNRAIAGFRVVGLNWDDILIIIQD